MVNVSHAVHRGIAVVEVIQSRLNGRGWDMVGFCLISWKVISFSILLDERILPWKPCCHLQ